MRKFLTQRIFHRIYFQSFLQNAKLIAFIYGIFSGFERGLLYAITREGAVRTKKGTYKYYKNNQTLVRSELTRVSKWTGLWNDDTKGMWDGIGVENAL